MGLGYLDRTTNIHLIVCIVDHFEINSIIFQIKYKYHVKKKTQDYLVNFTYNQILWHIKVVIAIYLI